VPNAKLIVIFRNPADRAYSNYMQAVRIGSEKLEFKAALEAEPNRITAGWSPFFTISRKVGTMRNLPAGPARAIPFSAL
jgi:hypothetical protein